MFYRETHLMYSFHSALNHNVTEDLLTDWIVYLVGVLYWYSAQDGLSITYGGWDGVSGNEGQGLLENSHLNNQKFSSQHNFYEFFMCDWILKYIRCSSNYSSSFSVNLHNEFLGCRDNFYDLVQDVNHQLFFASCDVFLSCYHKQVQITAVLSKYYFTLIIWDWDAHQVIGTNDIFLGQQTFTCWLSGIGMLIRSLVRMIFSLVNKHSPVGTSPRRILSLSVIVNGAILDSVNRNGTGRGSPSITIFSVGISTSNVTFFRTGSNTFFRMILLTSFLAGKTVTYIFLLTIPGRA